MRLNKNASRKEGIQNISQSYHSIMWVSQLAEALVSTPSFTSFLLLTEGQLTFGHETDCEQTSTVCFTFSPASFKLFSLPQEPSNIAHKIIVM